MPTLLRGAALCTAPRLSWGEQGGGWWQVFTTPGLHRCLLVSTLSFGVVILKFPSSIFNSYQFYPKRLSEPPVLLNAPSRQ